MHLRCVASANRPSANGAGTAVERVRAESEYVLKSAKGDRRTELFRRCEGWRANMTNVVEQDWLNERVRLDRKSVV